MNFAEISRIITVIITVVNNCILLSVFHGLIEKSADS